ncbi:TPA: glycosyltransferase family 2 protein [Vibrio vulnificus]|nr:glycosyltransferase family 2 protein [Vibrio vulnificus]ELV8590209.1 glycosyltransferase family 2 protein [Vibrio vulnificus]
MIGKSNLMPSLIFIFTNFNNSDFTEKALRSIQDSDAIDEPVIVVDNGSKEIEVNKLKELEKQFSNLTVIYNRENLGYFAGLNAGIKEARELPSYTPKTVLVVGNNDLLFDRAFKKQIFADETLIERYPVISPNIRMLDGTQQNPHVIEEISKVREFIYDIYHTHYLFAGMIVKLAQLTHSFTDRKDEEQFDVEQEIYQGYGACYLLTAKYFELFDRLPNDTFLMYEEFFLAKQLRSKGFKFYYRPTIKIQHYCHASTGLIPGKLKWQYSKKAHKEYRKYVKVWSKEY